jgi:hypothetical protein
MINSIVRDVTPHSPLKVYRSFEGTYHLHIQGRRISQATNQHVTGSFRGLSIVNKCHFVLHLYAVVVKYCWGENLRGSPGLLRDHLCGNLPIRKIRPKRECLLTDWLLNCCWPSPAQWFFVPSPAGLMTIFYSLTALGAFRLLWWLLVGWVNCCWASPVQPVLIPSPAGLMTTTLSRIWESCNLWLLSVSELFYDWRFTANQFVLASSLLRLMIRIAFCNWTVTVIVLMLHSIWREGRFVSYEYVWPLSHEHIAHTSIACH